MQDNKPVRWMLEQSEKQPEEAIEHIDNQINGELATLESKKPGGKKNQPLFELIEEDELREYVHITVDSELDGLHLKTANYEYSFLDMSEEYPYVEVERRGYNKPNTLEKALACHTVEHYGPETDDLEETAVKLLTAAGLAYLGSKTASEIYRHQDFI